MKFIYFQSLVFINSNEKALYHKEDLIQWKVLSFLKEFTCLIVAT